MTARAALTPGRWLGAMAVCAAIVVLAALAGLGWGSSGWGPLQILAALGDGLDANQRLILVEARLPRVLFGLLVGAALACSGAVFQAILRNPLADPYILGVSGGAALGGTLVVAFGASFGVLAGVPVAVASFAGALGAIAVIALVGSWTPGGRTGAYVLLLSGVIFNAFAGAIITFIRTILSPQKAHELLFYLVGSLDVEGVAPSQIALVAVAVVACVVGICWHARDLNVLSLGDAEARSLGVDVRRTQRNLVLAASLGVAVSVAYTGLIGFVGLVVPHGVRLALGPDHRLLLPASALVGGAFVVLADLVARAAFGVFAAALPVGVMTAFVGGPVFLFFLHRTLRRAPV